MNRMKRDVQMTLLSRIPVMLLSFSAVVFLTRLLGPEGNGVYTFTMAALNLFFTVVGFQLEGSVPVFLAKDKENRSAILSAMTLLAAISFVAFTVLLSVTIFLIPGGAKYVIAPGQSIGFFFLFLLFAFFLRRISTLILASLRGFFLFKAFNGYMIIAQLIPSITYGILLWMVTSGSLTLSIEICFWVILCIESVLVIIG